MISEIRDKERERERVRECENEKRCVYIHICIHTYRAAAKGRVMWSQN